MASKIELVIETHEFDYVIQEALMDVIQHSMSHEDAYPVAAEYRGKAVVLAGRWECLYVLEATRLFSSRPMPRVKDRINHLVGGMRILLPQPEVFDTCVMVGRLVTSDQGVLHGFLTCRGKTEDSHENLLLRTRFDLRLYRDSVERRG